MIILLLIPFSLEGFQDGRQPARRRGLKQASKASKQASDDMSSSSCQGELKDEENSFFQDGKFWKDEKNPFFQDRKFQEDEKNSFFQDGIFSRRMQLVKTKIPLMLAGC